MRVWARGRPRRGAWRSDAKGSSALLRRRRAGGGIRARPPAPAGMFGPRREVKIRRPSAAVELTADARVLGDAGWEQGQCRVGRGERAADLRCEPQEGAGSRLRRRVTRSGGGCAPRGVPRSSRRRDGGPLRGVRAVHGLGIQVPRSGRLFFSGCGSRGIVVEPGGRGSGWREISCARRRGEWLRAKVLEQTHGQLHRTLA